MDTDQTNKTQPLPSKLRWRPYANGTSKKNSKLKKGTAQSPNPKAAAQKIRGQQYYSNKSGNAPAGIKLQWEEAETVESMSHGGHPHNQHHSQLSSDRSRNSSPSASSDTSSSSWSSQDRAKSNNPFASAMQRAVASLPSPPSSKSPTTTLDLVGGQSGFGQYKASIPELTGGNGFSQNGLHLNTMASENAYQIALSALLQSQNIKSGFFHTPAIIGGSTNGANASLINSSNNNNNNTTAAPIAPAAASTLLGSSNINNIFLSDPDRVLSNQELLGVASIDELLASCGYTDGINNGLDNQAVQMLASPTNSDQSINSSPMNGLLDFNNNAFISRATSPPPVSFSPMALANAAFEALLAQPVASQQPTLQQQQQSPMDASSSNDPYDSLMMELAAPFGYLSTGGDAVLNSAPTAWPSLFPGALEDQTVSLNSVGSTTTTTSAPQRSEIATQTDGPYEPPLSPISAKASGPSGSPLSTIGISDEELDPDWLSFLDEASEIINEIDMPSPSPSGDENASESATSNAAQQDRSVWNWAEQLLKPSVVTPASRGFPTSGPTMTGMPNGSIGNGGLIRTLQSTSQQKTNKPSSASSGASSGKVAVEDPKEGKDAGAKAAEPIKNETKTTVESEPKERLKDMKQEEGGLGGLISILKSLWIGNDGNNKK
ncbi:hypothetical protein BGX27_005065 [Mortierella sp. AM989]|nr:hypothetical protein BGX27_005065 [Mortierella sp. AM989]